ncbi:MAG: hypothetical protein HYT80_02920 [Euryarchaeota archaeon]|nr:hypothetical protein [Euryarchaeota archaeon]
MVFVLVSGCFGVETLPATPPPSQPASDSPTAANEYPVPRLRLANAEGVEGRAQFVGEDILLSADASSDPDGTIRSRSWKVFHQTDPSFLREHEGANLTLRLEETGDYTAALYVTDDRGATAHTFIDFSVNRHRVTAADLVLSPALPVGELPPAVNLSLPTGSGILALSLNATFPRSEGTRLRLEIRAPNNTVLNRTHGSAPPLWAVALPVPAASGNYTALAWLDAGTAVAARFEFVAWYGYNT